MGPIDDSQSLIGTVGTVSRLAGAGGVAPSLDMATYPPTLSPDAPTLQTTLAAMAGVGPSQVQLSVTEGVAGGVELTAVISISGSLAAAAARSSLSTQLATAEQSAALLNLWNVDSTCAPVVDEALKKSSPFGLEVVLCAAGSVADVSDAEKAQLRAIISAQAGVAPGQVTVGVVAPDTEGGVLLMASLALENRAAATTARSALSSSMRSIPDAR